MAAPKIPGRQMFLGLSSTLIAKVGRAVLDLQTSKTNGATFLTFLDDQLRAEMAKRYRMNGDHALVGHSLGGWFVGYTTLGHTGCPRCRVCAESGDPPGRNTTHDGNQFDNRRKPPDAGRRSLLRRRAALA